jgi:UDP-4-amino-4-deoxy-L-arabinose formyltransferase/UDP-glucuronic acid dehydrogenase (UDP-4-keto-hexauronic acid decarboxylating)
MLTENWRLKIVLAAEESAGVQVLRALHAAPEAPEIVAVASTTSPEHGRRPLVAQAVDQLGLPLRSPAELQRPTFASWLRDREVDILLNVHSLFVLGADVVAAPRLGSFNLHPGPLPEYAGLNAPSWAIYRGEPRHAVTLHWMDAGIDSGPIVYASSFEIDESDTGLSLTGKCIRHGVPLALRLVADATQDPSSVPARAQDLRQRQYFGHEVPSEGRIFWSASAREIVRFVRAADYMPFTSPWGVPRAKLGNRTVGIAKASLTGESTDQSPGSVASMEPRGSMAVAAADEWVAVHRLWLDGRYVKPADICSAGDQLGDGNATE